MKSKKMSTGENLVHGAISAVVAPCRWTTQVVGLSIFGPGVVVEAAGLGMTIIGKSVFHTGTKMRGRKAHGWVSQRFADMRSVRAAHKEAKDILANPNSAGKGYREPTGGPADRYYDDLVFNQEDHEVEDKECVTNVFDTTMKTFADLPKNVFPSGNPATV